MQTLRGDRLAGTSSVTRRITRRFRRREKYYILIILLTITAGVVGAQRFHYLVRYDNLSPRCKSTPGEISFEWTARATNADSFDVNEQIIDQSRIPSCAITLDSFGFVSILASSFSGISCCRSSKRVSLALSTFTTFLHRSIPRLPFPRDDSEFPLAR